MTRARRGPAAVSLAWWMVLGMAAAALAQEPAFPAVSVGELRSRAAEMKGLEAAPAPGSSPAREGSLDRAAVAARAYPFALLSANAYEDRVEDWCVLLDRRRDPGTGFDAFSCRDRSSGRVAVVFRGTDELKDWLRADIPQPIVVPRQYRQGLEYVRELGERHGSVVLAGHSLGGGIAQYVAATLGLEAWTFNPAGLGLDALLRIGTCASAGPCRPDASRITNIIVAGEPLAAARFFGPGLTRLYGAVVHFLPAGGGFTSHGMSSVRAALEAVLRKTSGAGPRRDEGGT